MSFRINSFQNDLSYSHNESDKPYWNEIYIAMFPGMSHRIDHRSDMERQRRGVDVTVVLRDGMKITVDEKVRRKHYEDIALEYVSNDVSGAPGWVCNPKTACDYIAYIVPPGTCYFLPLKRLQAAWEKNKARWWETYGNNRAINITPTGRYETDICCVPPDVLAHEVPGMKAILF